MDRTILKSLLDIKLRIDEIDGFFINTPKRFDEYISNTMLRCALHMNLSIIGEATNRILKEYPEIHISHARQIVNTRNYLIHGYDSLRPEMIWAIIINDLPVLYREVCDLINEGDS